MTQINPPYDGSPPCPACQPYVRGLAALLHNAYNRFDHPNEDGTCPGMQGKFFVKMSDLRIAYDPDVPLTIDHPAARAVVELTRDIMKILNAEDGLVEDGLMLRWTPTCRSRLLALYDRWCKVCYDYSILSDDHFEDNRHCSGTENLLIASRGYKFYGYGRYIFPNPRDYDYVVEVGNSDNSHLMHKPCGALIHLHDHFLQKMRRDPGFYGRCRCPECGVLAPMAQFKILSLSSP